MVAERSGRGSRGTLCPEARDRVRPGGRAARRLQRETAVGECSRWTWNDDILFQDALDFGLALPERSLVGGDTGFQPSPGLTAAERTDYVRSTHMELGP